MFVLFNTLPDDARVWIYKSNREFTDGEIIDISEKARDFIGTWQRHGEDLRASFEIKYNQFLVLAVDESFNDVSGCSIDSSVRFIKDIESTFAVDMMNKMITSFKDGDNINSVSLPMFQTFAKEGKINGDTIVFNNLVQSKLAFEQEWEVSASKSWHQRFLNMVK